MPAKTTPKQAKAARKTPERTIDPNRPHLGHLEPRQIGYLADPPTWDETKQSWVNKNGIEICGSARAQGGICCQPKGWGTDHVGYGRCKRHGGSHANGKIQATKERIRKERPILGKPLNIGPHEAILREVQQTAGHVEWLRHMIQTLADQDESDVRPRDGSTFEDRHPVAGDAKGRTKRTGEESALSQFTPRGIAPSVWLEMYQTERQHLVAVCKAAVSMGVAERQVRIAEEQGNLIATVVLNIFKDPDLGLSAKQRNALPDIARRHFALISSGEIAGELPPAPMSERNAQVAATQK